MAEDQRVVKRATLREDNEAITLMSQSRGNKTFIEISGIPEYLIGPSDVLEINSHIGDQVTSATVTVNSRGKISYSFIDDLEVNGLSPSQLDELITEKMSAFIKSPRIDVLVKEFNSKINAENEEKSLCKKFLFIFIIYVATLYCHNRFQPLYRVIV